MSKRISRFLALSTLLVLAITAVPARHVLPGPQRASVTSATARNAAIVAATNEVLKETSEIRELAILRPVKSGAQSRTEIEQMLIKNLNEQMTPAEMHATEVSLRKFGLAPADFEYRPFIIKLLTEQVAGYYDPKVREFHLADWLELEGQKPVMAHELTHALQDQHFNLRRFEKWPPGESDAELSVHALIEGDATLAMTLYMAKYPLVALAFGRSLATGVATEQFNQAPRALRESLIFPYLHGMEWTTQLYKRGGWPMISNAFTRLPLSTEQILHPEKYFNYERPIKVVLPDVTHLLTAAMTRPTVTKQSAVSNQPSSATGVGPRVSRHARSAPKKTARGAVPTTDLPLQTPSWRRIDSDVNGEWTYYLILDQFLNAPAESKRAAAGWAGDRYALYEGPGGQVFLAQLAVWDTEGDAREFLDAYVKRTELRYAGAKRLDPSELKLQTSNTLPHSSNLYAWNTGEGSVIVELRGSRIVILEGIPEAVDAEKLLELFWR